MRQAASPRRYRQIALTAGRARRGPGSILPWPLLLPLVFLVSMRPDRGLADEDAGTQREYARLIDAGNRLYEEGDFTGAEEAYIQARNERPESAPAAFNIGNTYFLREDYTRAMERYEEALRFVRADRELEARVKYNLATAHIRQAELTIEDVTDPEKVQTGLEHLEQAITGYRDVLEIAPDHDDARHNLAVAQLRVKKLMDDLKRLREEAARNQEEEKGQSPVEILRELIAEEKAEIGLTETARDRAAEERRLGAYHDRVASLVDSLETDSGDRSTAARVLEELRALEGDPELGVGGAEVSSARRALEESAGGEGGRAALTTALERLGEAREVARGEKTTALEKDRTDQEATRQKALGLVQGIQGLLEGKAPPGGPADPRGQQPPAPQPPPPEVAAILQAVSGLTAEAATDMDRALRGLGGEAPVSDSTVQKALDVLRKASGNAFGLAGGDEDDDGKAEADGKRQAKERPGADRSGAGAEPGASHVKATTGPLDTALTAQRDALAKLERALEEAGKLPREEPPPGQPGQQDQQQDQEQQGEKEEQDGDQGQDGEPEQEAGEGEKEPSGDEASPEEEQHDGSGQEGEAARAEKERELSKEEAERLLREFLERDAARDRRKQERMLRRPGGGRIGPLDKDW